MSDTLVTTYDLLSMHEKGVITKASAFYVIENEEGGVTVMAMPVAGHPKTEEELEEQKKRFEEMELTAFDVSLSAIMDFLEDSLPDIVEKVLHSEEGRKAREEVKAELRKSKQPNLKVVK